MSDNIQNTDTSEQSLDTKTSSLPYVLDFMKYVSGFAVIILIALIVINIVSSRII